MSDEVDTAVSVPEAPRGWRALLRTEDWCAIWLGAFILLVAWASTSVQLSADGKSAKATSPLQGRFALPGKWEDQPGEAFFKETKQPDGTTSVKPLTAGIVISGITLLVLFALGTSLLGTSPLSFALAFMPVFLLAVLAYLLAGQSVIESMNLEYALWALLVGMLISNTVGTPAVLHPAVRTEFYIKTGLVVFGAEVLMSKLLALSWPGVLTSWTVTPIVLITTYIFGQKVLRMASPSLNMVISADMSVCGVSAAIATAAACRAKKEELSLAIGMSLVFTVAMMVAMPVFIRAVGMDKIVGGAWLGGTIDSTGAVAAAGAALQDFEGDDAALTVAATVKMIQNVLIGVVAFGVAVYWVTYVEPREGGSQIGLMEIWRRFPKFVLGFLAASALFSALDASGPAGAAVTKLVTGDVTRILRGWLFGLAFVSIGLETNFRQFAPYLKGGKPLVLYLCGQALNVAMSLLMSWLMFGVLFREQVEKALEKL